ncbi:F-box/LRR-repeat protein [Thalictrum thalictroides]|uniref:F-box/LRR-repeat protein n=1 Tax=Thalictrum thalictroides TaxID=46969 RepID=A0A7J6X913_THATH|nr:F-box/LRR-repeat protein [Thalictrum thalictroides]
MKGYDLINTILPEELILEIFTHLEESKSTRDSSSLVCKKWLKLERLTRKTIRIGATGNPDDLVKRLTDQFTNVRYVYFDERLPVSSPPFPQFGSSSSYRSRSNQSKKRRRNRSTGSFSELQPKAEYTELETIDLESFSLTDSGMTALARVTRLEKLSLIWCSSVTSAGLKSIAENCKSLKCLDLQGCYVGNEGLAAVGKCCRQLEDLNLRFCEGLTDTGLVELAAGCGKSLKVLGIAACANITDTSLEAVGSHCTFLQTLSLDSEFIKNNGIVSVAQGCSLLKVLKLQCINVTDEALLAVGTYCSSLELLALYSFQRFTDRSLCAIGKKCKKLKNLTLSDCYFLSDKSLEAIGSGCSQLTHLEVNGCHNIGTFGLESIGRSCPSLSELALLYCQKIGNHALYEVGRGCRLLQALHLVDCSSIGDDAIYNIAQGCKNLKKLHIRRCYEIGDRGIIAIGENCKYLMDLSLRFCDRVGDDALIAVGQGCSLRHLNVSGCHQIGDAGIMAIASGCPQLVYLDISVLQNLSDIALAELGEGCPLLRDVILSHCRKITDVGLSHLVKKCTRLETCHMVYCPFVTSVGVATVVSSCVNLKKILVEKWKMERKTDKTQATGICHRLFNFLIENFLFRGLKRVTLGRPMDSCSFSSPVTGGSNNSAVLAGDNHARTTKPTEESSMHGLAYGMPRTTESLVERANKLSNSFPITNIGSSIHVEKNSDSESQQEDFFEVQSPSLRPIPVRGTASETTHLNINGQDEDLTRIEQAKVGERGKEKIIPSETVFRGRGPKNVRINEGAIGRDMEKKKGKNVSVNEKSTMVMEPEKDVKVRATTPMIPLISSAFNIDQRSDELIRRTREALRNS